MVGDIIGSARRLVVGGDGNIRCGRPDGDPFDGPFRCEPTDWIAESPADPVLMDDGSGWLRMPGPALTVQPQAAGEFAWHDPDADGPPEPRRDAFLVRAREDVSIDCGGCHQWDILGRIDPVDPPEPVESPGLDATLPPLELRAESAAPDANVALSDALSLVSSTRKWLLDPDGPGGPGLGDRPLAATWVNVTHTRASVQFHDYGDGRTVLVLLKMASGTPVEIARGRGEAAGARGHAGWVVRRHLRPGRQSQRLLHRTRPVCHRGAGH